MSDSIAINNNIDNNILPKELNDSAYSLQIVLKSFNSSGLDHAVAKISDMIKKLNIVSVEDIVTVAMPSRIVRFSLKRAPHGDSRSGDSFQIIYNKRVIFIKRCNESFLAVINSGKINIPSDVHVEIKPLKKKY